MTLRRDLTPKPDRSREVRRLDWQQTEERGVVAAELNGRYFTLFQSAPGAWRLSEWRGSPRKFIGSTVHRRKVHAVRHAEQLIGEAP